MATPSLRLAENVPGPFYVTSECIDCDQCRENAPGIYERNDTSGLSVVIRQPSTPEETALAMEALQGCPVEAIGCEQSDEIVPRCDRVAARATPNVPLR